MIFVTFVRKIYCDFFNDCEFVTSSAFLGGEQRVVTGLMSYTPICTHCLRSCV